jgi:hypothetical protein
MRLDGLKVCKECGPPAKPLRLFYLSATTVDKRETECMDCRRKAANARYAKKVGKKLDDQNMQQMRCA